jgi:8-oxo-dGTP pyrophosphatase MutT (NUDIX family)
VDRDEDDLTGVKREIMEEIGYDVESKDFNYMG